MEVHGLPVPIQGQTAANFREDDLAEKTPHGSFDLERCTSIRDASRDRDVQQLSRIAILPGGFLTDELRREACTILFPDIADTGLTTAGPILLGKAIEPSAEKSALDWRTLPRHRDESQVELDVHRSFVYYPNNESETKLKKRRAQLSNAIVATLREYPVLCYFQGYHDIVQVLLLVLGEDIARAIVPYLSILRIRDFMLPVLSPSFEHLQLVPAIVTAVDIDLAKHLAPAQPFFALSSTLTMFAHNIEDYQEIARLFDFLLAHEASLSMYLFATIILSRRKELFEIEPEDADMLHFTLSKLPQNIDLDALIERAMDVFRIHPPETLPLRAWGKISTNSVLKTTRSKGVDGIVSIQTLEDGIKHFHSQARQLERQAYRKYIQSSLWKHRRSIGGIGLAISIGVLSIWLQKNQGDLPAMLIAKFSRYSRSWFP